jgi:hypothetical protein
VPHCPGCRHHRHVVTLPSIQDSDSDESHELFLICGQFPPSEQPLDHPVDRQGVEEHVVLQT